MKKRSINRLFAAVAIATAALLQVACGGGGGDAGGEAAATPPAGSADLNPGLTGNLWFKLEEGSQYFTANANTGVQTLFGNRASRNDFFRPAPDGTRYLVHSYDAGVTSIRVFSRAGTLQGDFDVPGWVDDYRFSPDGNYVGLLVSDSLENNTTSPNNPDANRGVFIIDISALPAKTAVRAFYGRGDDFVFAFDWLPDGKYIYLKRGGRSLVTGSAKVLNGNEQLAGVVSVPATYTLGASLDASPDGSQLAVVFNWMDGPLPKSDVWVTNLQGGNAERMSSSGFSTPVAWSPDGNYLAIKHDTGSACVAGGCFGSCKMLYLPKTARNQTDADARPLRTYEARSTTPEGLSCRRDVYWTR
jgi:hypothetical protein